MEREVKFRAWDGERMRYNGFHIPANGELKLHSLISIMQYTGLKDKNGKEIYEGDIVQCPDCNNDYKTTKIIWSDGAWCLSHGNKEMTLQRWVASHFELEIIGNIYENPELLSKS